MWFYKSTYFQIHACNYQHPVNMSVKHYNTNDRILQPTIADDLFFKL